MTRYGDTPKNRFGSSVPVSGTLKGRGREKIRKYSGDIKRRKGLVRYSSKEKM